MRSDSHRVHGTAFRAESPCLTSNQCADNPTMAGKPPLGGWYGFPAALESLTEPTAEAVSEPPWGESGLFAQF